MLRTLRARLTFSYAILVAAVLIVVTVALSRVAFEFLTRGVTEAVAAAAADARRVAADDPFMSFDELQQRIVEHVARPGVIVVVSAGPPNARVAIGVAPEAPRRGPVGPPEDVPPRFGERGRPGGLRTMVMLASALGIHAELVHVAGGLVVIEPDLQRVQSALQAYVIALAVAVALAVIVAYASARFITAQAIAPLIAVTGQLRRFASGDFTPRPIISRENDEIGDLAVAYNGAAAQVASAFAERQLAEEQMRRFVADASHELRTPLTVIGGFVDVLRRAPEDPALRERAYATIASETRRMRGLIDRLIALARLERPEPPELGLVDLGDVVDAVVASAGALAPGRVHVHAEGSAVVYADEGELHLAVTNLVENALKYGAESLVDVTVSADHASGFVRVRDGGPGVAEADREHVFERFFRGERRGEFEGSGLGLAIAASVVRRAGGRLWLEDGTPGRTTFALAVPLAPREAERPVDAIEIG